MSAVRPEELDSPAAVERMVFASYVAARPRPGPDAQRRNPELASELLDRLGAPDRAMPCLVVAGSKGKGSTARILAKLLEVSGLRVGLMTSPHLIDFRERIRVDGHAISGADLVRSGQAVEPHVEALSARLRAPRYLSPTGVVLALALWHFREQGCQVAVLECGRGALYDDVAQVQIAGALISPIHREHVAELGPRLSQIAAHKAAVIPEGGWAVVAPQPRAVLDVLRKEAGARGARLLEAGWEHSVEVEREDLEGSTLTLTVGGRSIGPLHLSLAGGFQAVNAAVALAAAEAWLGSRLADEVIARALDGARWPGRLQRLAERPLVVVDGSVSALAARTMARLLRRSGRPHVAVLALSRGKDASGVVTGLLPWADRWILTRAANPHLRWDSLPWRVAVATGLPATRSASVAASLVEAKRYAGPAGTVALAGTQSAVGDALRWAGMDLESV